MVKEDITHYLTGQKISKWVYKVPHTIRQVGTSRFPKGILLRGINSWVGQEDIKLMSVESPYQTSSKREGYMMGEEPERQIVPERKVIYIYEPIKRVQEVEAHMVEKEEAHMVEENVSFYLKTNLLYDLATVANLGLEIGFKEHHSMDLAVNFSPWTTHSKYRLRVFSVQPEFRYWFKQEHTGHHVGVHGIVGLYNISFGDSHRYQTHMIDDKLFFPALGVGLSYGYSLWLDKKREEPRWFMEFNVGLGYVYERYDSFYNVENGSMFSCGDEHHYVGPTKLEVVIGCRLGDVKKKNK